MTKLPDSLLSAPEERGSRIRFVRDTLLRLSREEFCLNSEISHQSLKAWELAWGGGLTESGAKKFVDRARNLGIYCTTSWLMYGMGTPATQLTENLNISAQEEEHIAKEAMVFNEIPNSTVIIAKDDGMVPIIYPGNYVGGIFLDNIDKAVDHLCIIIDANGNSYIRILKSGNEKNRYNLVCYNKNTHIAKEIKNISIKQAAPVIWIRKLLQI